MIKTHTIEHKVASSKGQKIVAALFLISGHLPENDPLRLRLRTLAVSLVDSSIRDRGTLSVDIITLLHAASLANIINENNVQIIETEIKYFVDPRYFSDTAIVNLFPGTHSDKGHLLTKRTQDSNMSFINKEARSSVSEKKHITTANKIKRQEKILSYINERKSVNVKDISSLFLDVSEKTIQRELGLLVSNGKIRKRGNKRWSIYLAI